MKVFDVTINEVNPLQGGHMVSVFAEDAAQAVRIAVRAINKKREKLTEFEYTTGRHTDKPVPELLAENVTKVEVIRDRVAS